jgi:limonene-1,2-epoxide hydrolase
MATNIRPIVEAMFAGVSAKDVDAAVAPMSKNIELYDPHYPYPTMNGVAEVREGLTWAFGQMISMGFDVQRWFPSEDGLSVVVEVATHHVLKVGKKKLDFPQVFVIDTDGTSITRMRAYEPYGPHGSTGFGLKIGHAVYRMSHRRKA